MGEVVLAEHVGLGKKVVVKLLHEQFAKNPELVQRMQIEARSLAAVESPHVVQVTDLGQSAKGRTYIVMERLVGRTLRDEVKARGSLPCAEAIAYVLDVLAGLHAAHALGIIHRDIKMDNIFLCDPTNNARRMAKILDFGVAKVLSVPSDVSRPALPHVLTAEGDVVGTPRVVAPEQAYGKPVDARTDIYATGLLLYALVVGRGPFAHLTETVDLLKANVTERPARPSEKAAQPVPLTLDAAILRALEKRPDDRFQSAEDFARELRCILGEMSSEPPVAATTTGPLAEPAHEPTGRTVQLAGAALVATTNAATPASHDGAEEPHAARVLAAAPPLAVPAPARSRWGTFLALALLSAAISTVLLVALYWVVTP
jgi:serine/threonine-protein kinase